MDILFFLRNLLDCKDSIITYLHPHQYTNSISLGTNVVFIINPVANPDNHLTTLGLIQRN